LIISDPFSFFTAATLYTETPKSVKPIAELQKAAIGAFAAMTIASSALAPPAADAMLPGAFASSSQMVAEKVVREGLYKDYEVEVAPQAYDDAASTFKSAKETKSKKGKSIHIHIHVCHVVSCV
jgi:hypothetical protein